MKMMIAVLILFDSLHKSTAVSPKTAKNAAVFCDAFGNESLERKHAAKIIINSFTGSAIWIERLPKVSQREAPCEEREILGIRTATINSRDKQRPDIRKKP